MDLRQKTNKELFALYEGELAFHHRSKDGINEAKRILGHFHDYLGEFPPTPELAKSFLSKFSVRKPATLARYAAVIKMFFKWYGEELDLKLKVPKILPSYVQKADIEKLQESILSKRTHKGTQERDLTLIDLAIHTGLRRTELANLSVCDIDIERQVLVVRKGKGAKDRVIPLSGKMIDRLSSYIKGKERNESLFGLAPATISGMIRFFARKAGLSLHTHSLRDFFATSLSEKGATIREIQSLLGHANLTHTERYTLHTDKHLRQAVELLDGDQIREDGRLVGYQDFTCGVKPPDKPSNDAIALDQSRIYESSIEITVRPAMVDLVSLSPLSGTTVCAPVIIDLECHNIIIQSIRMELSDTNLQYKFMLFEIEPPNDPLEWERNDILRMKEINRQVFTFYPKTFLQYSNYYKRKQLYGGIVVGQRNIRFDLPFEDQEKIEAYYTAPVTLRITVQYKQSNLR